MPAATIFMVQQFVDYEFLKTVAARS